MTKHDSVQHLQQLMMRGDETVFDLVPTTLANVISQGLWRQRTDKDGQPFVSFEAFVAHKLWFGLESTIDDLLVFCRKRPDVQQLIKGEVGELSEHGTNQHDEGGDNVTSTNRGNSPTYALRRLKRDRPDLAEQVVAGTLSANAAAIMAGFRHKPTRLELIQREWKNATEVERSQIHPLICYNAPSQVSGYRTRQPMDLNDEDFRLLADLRLMEPKPTIQKCIAQFYERTGIVLTENHVRGMLDRINRYRIGN